MCSSAVAVLTCPAIRTESIHAQSPMMLRFSSLAACLLLWATDVHSAVDRIAVSIDAAHPGPQIDRNIFGQFAEHLGHGVYEGIWVGPESPIPNTRGIRNDVVAALRALKVPNVRWPGGCFADNYHWRNGIGPRRAVTLNPDWGGVTEPNSFGTHEFMDFAAQIGAAAYISINMGSGTPEEAAEWLEYLTSAQPTTLAQERGANGHAAPYRVAILGIGNESWDCGGNMTPEYYVSQLKIYSRFVRNFHPQQQDSDRMLRIAVGPGGDEPRFTEWTEAVMKAWQARKWSWDIEGLSLHNYTVMDWQKKHAAVGFGEREYAEILQATLKMDSLITKHTAIMDKYDPEKKLVLAVDEWGAWFTDAGHESGIPGAAEQPARCAARCAQHPHLRATCGPRAHRQHRADDQCAAGHDPDGRGEDASDPDVSRIPHVRAIPECHLHPGAPRCGNLHAGLDRAFARGCHWREGCKRQALARARESGSEPVCPDRGQLRVPRFDRLRANSDCGRGRQRQRFEAPQTLAPKPMRAAVAGGKLVATLASKSISVISLQQ